MAITCFYNMFTPPVTDIVSSPVLVWRLAFPLTIADIKKAIIDAEKSNDDQQQKPKKLEMKQKLDQLA